MFRVLILVLILSVSTFGAVPPMINYQGLLTDQSTGDPLPGPVNIVFSLYSQVTGSGPDDPLWSETHNGVALSDGLFDVQLGGLDETLFSEPTRWLQITVDGEDITPRVQMVCVPYAFHSSVSDSSEAADVAYTVECDGCITQLQLATNSVHADELAPDAVASQNIQNGTIKFEDIDPNEAGDGQVMKRVGGVWVAANDETGTGSQWTVTNSVIYTNDYWGISRGNAENMLYGDNSYTHTNLGVACTTGTDGQNNSYGTIGGGRGNTATDHYCTVGGGDQNEATSGYSTIGGGRWNDAGGDFATVGGGYGNQALNDYSTIAGGSLNDANGNNSAIGGGESNTATDWNTTVSGGINNNATGHSSTVGGGSGNDAVGEKSVISGGSSNEANGLRATVSGGSSNISGGEGSSIGGGQSNQCAATYSVIAGGKDNLTLGTGTTIGGGEDNIASENYSTVSGGRYNMARGEYSVIAGGGGPTEADSNSALGDYSAIGGGMRHIASGDYSFIGGGYRDTASGYMSCVGGGHTNTASGYISFIGGGKFNKARGEFSVVAGGGGSAYSDSNAALGDLSVVSGGKSNIASGSCSSVGGGQHNTASGEYSVVPGGYTNSATGDHSFALGRNATASHDGSFVWNDDNGSSASSTAINQFKVAANGGVYLYVNSGYYFRFKSSIGAGGIPNNVLYCSNQAVLSTVGVWTDAPPKRDKMKNITEIDRAELLDKIATLPISRWNHKEGGEITHISPFAQDFHAVFGVGSDEGMAAMDQAGIALAAIQELYKKNKELERKTEKIEQLESQVEHLTALVNKILENQ